MTSLDRGPGMAPGPPASPRSTTLCGEGSRWRQWPIWIAGRLRWLRFTREGTRLAEREFGDSFNGIFEFTGKCDQSLRLPTLLWLGLLAGEPEIRIDDVMEWVDRIEEKGWYRIWVRQFLPLPRVYAWMIRPFRPKEERPGGRGEKSCPM